MITTQYSHKKVFIIISVFLDCHRAGGYDMLTGGQPERDWAGAAVSRLCPASEDPSPVTIVWVCGGAGWATIGPAFRQHYRLFSPH